MDQRHLRRTWIITPAIAPDRFLTARTAGADIAMVDLEDSVAFSDKQRAREQAKAFFAPHAGLAPLGIRVNAPGTPDGARDLLEITAYFHKPKIVLVPKVESPRDIEHVCGLVDTSEYTPEIYALIETPRGIENASAIVRATRLSGVVFGAADYAATTGCRMTWDALLYARSALIASAAARGLPAVDSPFFDLHDSSGLTEECQRARALGYSGKGAVHPRQVPVIDQAFRPTDEELDAAHAILAAARGSGGSITSVGGAMVGRPFFLAAMDLATQAGANGPNAPIPTREHPENPS